MTTHQFTCTAVEAPSPPRFQLLMLCYVAAVCDHTPRPNPDSQFICQQHGL